MKLHNDIDSFRVLIDNINEQTGYRTDVLEKDYYVVLMLEELAKKQQNGLPAYFKGGTALYKALKTTNRFSEDIDLSIETRDCTNSQGKRRLENATKKYECLTLDSSAGENKKNSITSVYLYNPITEYDPSDALQRFGKLKIEATSFTISEPVEDLEVAPLLYDAANEEQQAILREQYEVAPFIVKTISLERIFIDKLFAAESYVRKFNEKNYAFEAAKHIYDLSVLESHPRVIKLMSDNNRFKVLLDIRMEEETRRLDGITGVLPNQFIFFDESQRNSVVKSSYETMQSQYVLKNEDKIDFALACDSLHKIKDKLDTLPTWKNYEL